MSEFYIKDQQKRLASEYQHNPEMENLLKLQRERPGEYEKLPASKRLQLGHYTNRKHAAESINSK